jgi:hypothetical protein
MLKKPVLQVSWGGVAAGLRGAKKRLTEGLRIKVVVCFNAGILFMRVDESGFIALCDR